MFNIRSPFQLRPRFLNILSQELDLIQNVSALQEFLSMELIVFQCIVRKTYLPEYVWREASSAAFLGGQFPSKHVQLSSERRGTATSEDSKETHNQSLV